ncbi:RNA polymerase sigma factor [Kibdelosporangium lantanae]
MPSPPDDATVIRESVPDPERFALIFDRHGPAIQRYLARRLGADVADDLVAETFLTAFHKRGRYDRTRPDARPWLYGIATNLVSRHRRAEVRWYRLKQVVPPERDQQSHADEVAAQVTAQAMGRLLAVALAELAERDRDVLLLIAWEGLAYDEVAAALGIPVGTVRSRLNRARRKVREVLDAPEHATTTNEEVSRHG